ncbi:diguanylate cyclase domain-containing protein [Rhodocyclaceae bacterium SMB388]
MSSSTSLILLGVLAALTLQHLLLVTVLRTRIHAEFMLLIAGLGVALSSLPPQSANLQWLPATAGSADRLAPVGLALVGLFGSLLSRSMLQRSRSEDILNRFMTGSAAMFGAVLVLLWFVPAAVGTAVLSVAIPLFAALVIVCGARSVQAGMRRNVLYTSAWVVMLAGFGAHGARDSGWVPSGLATDDTLFLATVFAAILMSSALILHTRQGTTGPGRALAGPNRANEELIETLRASEETLAARLAERTEALEHANRELQEVRHALDQTHHHDALTGIANRLLLEDRAAHGMVRARRHNTRMALLVISLDHFAQVRERCGQAVADQLLLGVARRVKAVVRAQDTLARVSSEEFAIVLEEVFQQEDVERVRNIIVGEVEKPFTIGDRTLSLGVTIGCAFFPEDGKDPGSLLKSAAKQVHSIRERHCVTASAA